MNTEIKNKTKTIKKIEKKVSKKAELTISVYDLTGKVEKQLTLPKEIFAAKTSPKLLAQSVRVYLTNQRQGTASTKTRSQVTGSTRKIYRQKGTGRARHGDIKAPIFVGGGIVGGPQPKNYYLKINKKQKKRALIGALSLKYADGGLIGLSDQFLKIKPKTKILIEFFKKINLEKGKKLIIVPKIENNNLFLAARNIPRVEIIGVESINTYKVLNCQKIFILDQAIEYIKNINKQNEN